MWLWRVWRHENRLNGEVRVWSLHGHDRIPTIHSNTHDWTLLCFLQVIVAYLGHALKNPDMENAEKYHEVWSFEKKGFNELLAANYAESGVMADLR